MYQNHLRRSSVTGYGPLATGSAVTKEQQFLTKSNKKWKMKNEFMTSKWCSVTNLMADSATYLPLSFFDADLFPLSPPPLPLPTNRKNEAKSYRWWWRRKRDWHILDSINHCARLESQPEWEQAQKVNWSREWREECLFAEPQSHRQRRSLGYYLHCDGKTHKSRASKTFSIILSPIKIVFLSTFNKSEFSSFPFLCLWSKE